ncbi:acetylxylan esterase [Streptomyces virginiae]|uniref:acetylxylan esterase n=1 Tax=Streptomyces virginiae TaxID=1961 RepID=UPI0034134206
MPDVPFLCHFRHAAAICGDGPYQEIAKSLRRHSRHRVEPAFTTLDHFDGVRFARRATAPALFSVGLMDPVCPPSTVYAAFHHYAGEDRSMTVWPFGDHGGGCGSNPPVQLARLRARPGAGALIALHHRPGQTARGRPARRAAPRTEPRPRDLSGLGEAETA